MPDKVELRTFPSTKIEALTMLYLQMQDLHGKTPEEIVQLYKETYDKVKNEVNNSSSSSIYKL